MTPCDFPFETLSSYVDGQLDGEQGLEVRRHLDRCDRCRDLIEALLQMNEAIASASEVHLVPHALRERVNQLALPKRRRPKTLLWGALAAAAVLLIAVGVGLWATWSKRTAVDQLAYALIEDHVRYLKMPDAIQVASSDPRRIADSFQDRVGFPIELPELGNASLLGARFCWIKRHKALLSFYETHGRRFSIFAIDQDALPSGAVRAVRCTSFGRYEVCLLHAAPELLAMVGEKHETEAILPEFERFGAGRPAPLGRENDTGDSD